MINFFFDDYHIVLVACRGRETTAPGIQERGGIKRVKSQKLHFIKLLKTSAFLYRKSTNTCCMDLIGSCLGSMM